MDRMKIPVGTRPYHAEFFRELITWLFAAKNTEEQRNTAPDFVQVVSLLRASGFTLKNIASHSNTPPGAPQPGCIVNVQCQVSKIYANLVSEESNCLCPDTSKGSSWNITWAGATAGQDNVEGGGDTAAGSSLIPDLSPEKSELIRDVLHMLLKYVWSEQDSTKENSDNQTISRDRERKFKSLESLPVMNLESYFEIEYFQNLSIASNGTETPHTSGVDSQNESMKSNISFDSQSSVSPPQAANSAKTRENPKTKPKRLTLPNNTSRRSTSPADPKNLAQKMREEAYMLSSTMRAKRYAESLKDRDLARNYPPTRK